MKLAFSLFSLFVFAGLYATSQTDTQPTILAHQSITFIKNNGQWHENVNYRCPLGTGSVFLEDNVFTYSQLDADDINHSHHHSADGEEHHDLIDGHAWKMTFKDANPKPLLTGLDKRTEYHNYFLGNDPSKWASRVPLFDQVFYTDLYNGIDLQVYSNDAVFKYDFVVAPNADAGNIKMEYNGLDGLEIRDGHLISVTTLGEFIEKAPYAYQNIDGQETEVECHFVLDGNTVSFVFPNGYDKSLALIIDPELVGATLSGGTATNYGHCATYDNDENIYTGARCFGAGYPTEVGSFQTTFGGSQDIAVSKLSADATTLFYASYLGGSGNDLPHSMVVNDDNELYVFGTTRSIDYPVAADAFDSSGPEGGVSEDIIVTHLSVDGTDIVGSTFIGGDQRDGINTLTSNYGDSYRGEIVVDSDGNCYISTCSASDNFPTTAGVYQETYGGGAQDAVVFSMPPDLTSLNWSTYIGGASGEGALGLRLDFEDNLYVSGVASDEFMTMSGYQTTYQGGSRDAYVIRLIDDGSTISASSYWGTTATEAAFFVDLDNDGNVFLYGQSDGGLSEVTDDVYSNEGSHQFICKLSPNLEDLSFGTVVGAGGSDFVPIAFMVDACGYIYFSGHGASGALPLTDDALFETGGFYLGVLQPEAIDLEFSTLYSGNHVDGGTSRFDPANGMVYQAVCSCEEFTLTDGAYGTTPGGFCDIGVFKIDFGISHVNASADALPESTGCVPYTVDFENNSTGLTYQWEFDDGSPMSTEFEPTHTFTEPGVYDVRLVAFDPDGCLTSDTTYITITVGSGETPDADFEFDVNCATGEVTVTYTGTEGAVVVFDMGDGTTYTETAFSHTYDSDGSFTITLTAGDGVCAGFDSVTEEVVIGTPAVDVIFNSPTCHQFSDGSVTLDLLFPTGDEIIEITDIDGTLLNLGGSNTANTLSAGWYYFRVDLGDGCELIDSIELIDPNPMNAQLLITNPLCFGDKTGYVVVDTVFDWQGDSYDDMVYIWAPDIPDVSGLGADSIYDLTAGTYTVTINDGNGCSKLFDFEIVEPEELVFTEFGYDPAYCRVYDYQSGNGVVYGAVAGGTPDYHYHWTHLETGDMTSSTTWGGRNPGTYVFEAEDANGCILTDTIYMDSLNPIAAFTATIDQLPTDCDAVVPVEINFSNQSQNFANPNNPFNDTLFNWNFNHPINNWVISQDVDEEYNITYTQSGDYEVCLIAFNKNGCTDTSCQILKLCDDLVFEPVNIFSPDNDGINDEFTFVYRSEAVIEFYCVVLDRWGVKIMEFNDINQGWDGNDSKGNEVPDGVYYFKYNGKGQTGELFSGQGTVQKVGKK